MCCLRVNIVRCCGRRLAAAVLVVGAATTSMTTWSQIPQTAPPTGTQPAGVALQAVEAIPPRTISDITALLDQYKPDPQKAAQAQAELKVQPPATEDKQALARFYLGRARAAERLGLFTQQIADLRKAAELYPGADALGIRILVELAGAERQGGNYANIKGHLELAISRGADSYILWPFSLRVGLASFFTTIGELRLAQQEFATAEQFFVRAQRMKNWALNRSNFTAMLERQRGLILVSEGKYAQAEASFLKALALKEDAILMVMDRIRAGSTTSQEAPESSRDGIERNLAQALVLQGRLSEAELRLRNVLRSSLSRVGKYSVVTARAVSALSSLLSEQGRTQEARVMALAAVEIFEQSGSPPESLQLLDARRAHARTLVDAGRWSDAVAEYEKVRASVVHVSVLAQMFAGNRDWALALLKTGQAAAAMAMLEPIVARTSERLDESHYLTAELRGFLAMALAQTGDKQRALGEFRKAVRVLLADAPNESEEGGLPARGRRLAMILEAYIALLSEIHGSPLEREAGFDATADAFSLADAARGQAVQRALASSAARAASGNAALAEVIRKEQDAKQAVGVLYSTLLRLLNAPPDQQLPQVVAQMRARIQNLEKERRQLFADLERRFPAYVNLINPQPATVGEARAALREGEVLVSVLITQDRTYVWAVPRQGQVAFHAANLGEKELGRLVASLRRALDPGEIRLEQLPEFDVAGAYRLYAEVLKPVEAAWKGAHTLMVVANGPLAQLPFAVLPSEPANLAVDSGPKFERYKQVPWLVKQVAIAQLPAVNTLVTLRTLPQGNTARGPFIGYGDPHFGKETPAAQPVALRMRNLAVTRAGEGKSPVDWMPYSQLTPLPDTREEILAIATALKADLEKDVFLGVQASKQNVKTANLSTRRIVAFATHGLIPGDFPNLDQPALALSAPDGKSETGLLTLEDILGLKLDADWVVLSACNTAAGDGQGAEAISGLGRGFFYAGSRALLVTHWPVETRSARALVTEIFQRYAADPALTRAEALRQASLSLMEQAASDPASGKAVFSYAHPLFWAPYALVGDGGR